MNFYIKERINCSDRGYQKVTGWRQSLILKIGVNLLKDKTLEIISKYGRTEAQS